jgi:hypothetical protein
MHFSCANNQGNSALLLWFASVVDKKFNYTLTLHNYFRLNYTIQEGPCYYLYRNKSAAYHACMHLIANSHSYILV